MSNQPNPDVIKEESRLKFKIKLSLLESNTSNMTCYQL